VREGKGPERVASYDLEATLDPLKHTVDGRERLTWRNRSAETISAVYVHLYLNAFEGEGSTFARERTRFGGFRSNVETREGEGGSIELRRVEQGGRTVPWSYVHPDGGPGTDRTVVRLDLPEPVPPGGTTVLTMEFHDQLPRVVARTGWFGTYHLVAQWFPKIGVLELPGERGATEPRWNCHEFHLYSEFYADFGSYRAAITIPRGYRFGSVGTETAPPAETAQGVTYRVGQDDVHDFAFTAWDGFAAPLEASLNNVRVRVLHPPEYAEAAGIALRSTLDALGYFSRTLGPYPYPQITVVVPPWNAWESGAMEYETFFTTIGARGPPFLQLVRFVTVHEFGHGYFMGLIASNEFEEPFLDEGLDDFWSARMLDSEPLRIPAPGLLGAFGLRTPAIRYFELEREGTLRFTADPISENSWNRWSRGSYGQVYSRSALVFHDLEQRLGGDVLARAFRDYARRWRFRHPGTADLESVLAEHGGALVRDWFRDQVYASAPIDDRVESVEAERARQKPAAGEVESPWRSTVAVRGYGARVPQTASIRFEDGSVVQRPWPADERWQRWVFERPVRVVSAQIDPGRALLLDLDKLDDGRTREPARGASTRWGLEVEAWAALLLAVLGTL
jgi:hypothetical protein